MVDEFDTLMVRSEKLEEVEDRPRRGRPPKTTSTMPSRPAQARLAAILSGLLLIAVARAGRKPGGAINGIPCGLGERLVLHIRAHVAIYANGQPLTVPYGLGIGKLWQVQQSTEGPFAVEGSRFYWLHTHTDDGIIHIVTTNATVANIVVTAMLAEFSFVIANSQYTDRRLPDLNPPTPDGCSSERWQIQLVAQYQVDRVTHHLPTKN